MSAPKAPGLLLPGDPETFVASVVSHRARQRLSRLAGDLGTGWYRTREGRWPSGDYYVLPQSLREDARQIPGVNVLASVPRGLKRRWA